MRKSRRERLFCVLAKTGRDVAGGVLIVSPGSKNACVEIRFPWEYRRAFLFSLIKLL